MSGTQQIRSTIRSTQNTEKITRAMQLVATSKLGKNQARMAASKPYAEKMRQVLAHVGGANSEYHHPYLQARQVNSRVGILVVSTDRGLCGGLNINLFKQVSQHMQQWDAQNVAADVCVIGQKAARFFQRHRANIVGQTVHLGDKSSVMDVVGVVKVMLDGFADGQYDAVYLATNQFESVMRQQPVVLPLLPITALTAAEDVAVTQPKTARHWDYIYEPDAKLILDQLLNRYIESQVYQAVIENIACEQAARMIAMQNATDNAKQIIDDLRLVYNKARQAAITQELAEIVAGAAAV